MAIRVLFLCTGNSARSQIAEGLLRHVGGDLFDVQSAGTNPRPEVHPKAVEAMAERCDRATECRAWLGTPLSVGWRGQDGARTASCSRGTQAEMASSPCCGADLTAALSELDGAVMSAFVRATKP